MMRTYIKRVVAAIDAGDKAAAETAYKEACPVIDRVADYCTVADWAAAAIKSAADVALPTDVLEQQLCGTVGQGGVERCRVDGLLPAYRQLRVDPVAIDDRGDAREAGAPLDRLGE